MKKIVHPTATVLCLSLLGGSALAQSTVTLSGVVDAGFRYDTNYTTYNYTNGLPLPASSTNRFAFANEGGMTNNYWALKGSEDLGGGLSALFEIKQEFNLNNPNVDDTSFEISHVGLRSNSWGQITLGRQYNVLMKGVSMVYGSNLWAEYFNAFKPEHVLMLGSKSNNTLQYAAKFADVVLLTQYTVGEQSGASSLGTQYGATVAYTPSNGPIEASAGFLRSVDDKTKDAYLDIYAAGMRFKFSDTASVRGGIIVNKRNDRFNTFANANLAPTGALVGYGATGLQITPRGPMPTGGFNTRNMITVGFDWDVTPALTLSTNFWHTKQKSNTPNFNGSATQYQVLAGYKLSKRTMLYASVDHSIYKDGMKHNEAGLATGNIQLGAQLRGLTEPSSTAKGKQTGITFGIRHAF